MKIEPGYRVSMPGPDPDEDLELRLGGENFFVPGFGQVPCIYPVTLVQARYGGAYEGGSWLAFPVRPWTLNWVTSSGSSSWNDWNGSDMECARWWEDVRLRGVPVGRAATPEGALSDLLAQVAAAAGFKPGDWRCDG